MTETAQRVCLANGLIKSIGIGRGHKSRPTDNGAVLAAAGLSPEEYDVIIPAKAASYVPGLVAAWLGMLGRNAA